MKLWKQPLIQSYEEIEYFDTRKEFEAEAFALRLHELIKEERGAAKGGSDFPVHWHGPFHGGQLRAVNRP